MVLETSGPSVKLAEVIGEIQETSRLRKTISLAIVRGNPASVVSCSTGSHLMAFGRNFHLHLVIDECQINNSAGLLIRIEHIVHRDTWVINMG